MIPQEVIQEIKNKANDRIEEILAAFDIEINNGYSSSYDIRCCCPVHGGDNPTSFSYNMETCTWKCFSKNCHEEKSTLFGLVELLLNTKYHKTHTFFDALKWMANFVSVSLDGVSVTKVEGSDIDNIIKNCKRSQRFSNIIHDNDCKHPIKPIALETCVQSIKEDTYFINQGFTKETIKKFYIGYCDDKNKPMYKRSYALVLDEDGKNVIGATGRTHLEPCELCGLYHIQGYGCPDDNPKTIRISKWKHYGFLCSMNLYNLWNAKETIAKTNSVIITEGPKDVWWLDQCGIHNAVCIYGLNISVYQINMLIKHGVTRVVIALDNDEKGNLGTQKTYAKLSDYFKLIDASVLLKDGHDIADTDSDTIINKIKPLL